MARVIQARLDTATERICRRVQKQLGWSDSEVVREGIKLLSCFIRTNGRRKIVGVGKFESGISDLATNKKHLEDFGR